MAKKDEKKTSSPYRHVPLWGPTRKTIKLTPQNSGSFTDVVLRDEEGNLKFDAGVGDRIVVQRFNSLTDTKMDLNEGIIVGLDESGLVQWFDEVREQWFYFHWNTERRPLIFKRIEQGPTRQRGKRRRQKAIVDAQPMKETIELNELDHPLGSFVFDPPMTITFEAKEQNVAGIINQIELPVSGTNGAALRDDVGLKLNIIWDRFCVPDESVLDEAQVALRKRFLAFATRRLPKEGNNDGQEQDTHPSDP